MRCCASHAAHAARCSSHAWWLAMSARHSSFGIHSVWAGGGGPGGLGAGGSPAAGTGRWMMTREPARRHGLGLGV
eukprot:350893-Chlamydomonas_euryale.AAC.3